MLLVVVLVVSMVNSWRAPSIPRRLICGELLNVAVSVGSMAFSVLTRFIALLEHSCCACVVDKDVVLSWVVLSRGGVCIDIV